MFNGISKLVGFNNHVCFDQLLVNNIHADTSIQKKKLTVMSLCSQEIKEKDICIYMDVFMCCFNEITNTVFWSLRCDYFKGKTHRVSFNNWDCFIISILLGQALSLSLSPQRKIKSLKSSIRLDLCAIFSEVRKKMQSRVSLKHSFGQRWFVLAVRLWFPFKAFTL